MDNVSRETLGRLVRDAWIAWAQEQPDAKPTWLVPWDLMPEKDREADRRIGVAVAEYVSRETVEAPTLFWRVCADDPSLTVEHKLRWLVASYEYLVRLAGFSMSQERLDATIGTAAAMSRISDLLLASAGTDAELDRFIVRWLCLACDQLWEFVPPDARNPPDDMAPDAPRYNALIAEINRRIPGLVLPVKHEPDIRSRAGEEVLVIVCPSCQAVYFCPVSSSLCALCRAPLTHIQPIPYSAARKRDQ